MHKLTTALPAEYRRWGGVVWTAAEAGGGLRWRVGEVDHLLVAFVDSCMYTLGGLRWRAGEVDHLLVAFVDSYMYTLKLIIHFIY
jgi:hypothetical protein